MRLVAGCARPHIRHMQLRTIFLALAACSGTARTVDAPAPPERLALAGDQFYPESLSAAGDGRLFVGSFGTGAVAVFAADASSTTRPTTFIPASPEVARVLGVLADDAGHALWLCADDTATDHPAPPEV